MCIKEWILKMNKTGSGLCPMVDFNQGYNLKNKSAGAFYFWHIVSFLNK